MQMRKARGFSLIELLIVIAIILVIAAIAIPGFLRARIDSNESAAVAALGTLNTAQASYSETYPTVGFATTLGALGGTSCTPPDPMAGACLVDTVLAGGTRSGYSFVLGGAVGTPNASYQIIATPSSWNYTGVKYFCSFQDAVVRYSTNTITSCDYTVSPLN